MFAVPWGVMRLIAAGPPDAPLDVQLEPGPSPGIALISWLPVTIDAAGTSNGVRVTGYTIYADKKKARILNNHVMCVNANFQSSHRCLKSLSISIFKVWKVFV